MPRVTLKTNGGYYGDIPAFQIPDGGLSVAKNCYRRNGRWYPWPTVSTASTSDITGPRAIVCARYIGNSGVTDVDSYIFVADTTDIWRIQYDTSAGTLGTIDAMAKILSSGPEVLTDYNAVIGQFLIYEGAKPWVLYFPDAKATDPEPQVLKDIGGTDHFVDLGGSPKPACYAIYYQGHLITGNLSYSSANYPCQVQISAYNNIESFSTTFDITTGASMENFPDQGPISGLALLGRKFAIFHKDGISLGQKVDYPVWIAFQKGFIKGIGAVHGSVVSAGDRVFFWSQREAYCLYEDGTLEPIGDLRVAQTIVSQQRDRIMPSEVRTIFAHHWANTSNIIWGYNPAPDGSNYPTHLLFYNYREKTWSIVEDANCRGLFDVMLLSGRHRLGGLVVQSSTDTCRVKLYDGTNNTMTITTGEVKSPGSEMITIQRIRPNNSVSTATVACRVGTRSVETGSVTYSSSLSVDDNGYCTTLQTGRLVRVEVTTDQAYSSDIDVDFAVTGEV